MDDQDKIAEVTAKLTGERFVLLAGAATYMAWDNVKGEPMYHWDRRGISIQDAFTMVDYLNKLTRFQ